ncbi:MAG TPA: hypothetical protein VEB20_15975 [Azospirillaceae bacterium]|nr:hypothetical protein [Azospirillaceae bacterium]
MDTIPPRRSPTPPDRDDSPAGPLPGPGDLVAVVLEVRPELGAVFLARGMACPGCVMAPFMTVAEAAAAYAVDPDELVGALRDAASGAVPSGPFPPPRPHGAAAPSRSQP